MRIALAAVLALLAACADERTSSPATRGKPASSAPTAAVPAVAMPSLDREHTALLIAAYRFELGLHGTDADRAEFGAFFLDYPPAQEDEFLAAFARNSPMIRQRRWCRFTGGRAVIDDMTGKPGVSFVGEIRKIQGAHALVTMSWWSEPELAAAALMGLERTAGGWEVTGYQPLYFR